MVRMCVNRDRELRVVEQRAIQLRTPDLTDRLRKAMKAARSLARVSTKSGQAGGPSRDEDAGRSQTQFKGVGMCWTVVNILRRPRQALARPSQTAIVPERQSLKSYRFIALLLQNDVYDMTVISGSPKMCAVPLLLRTIALGRLCLRRPEASISAAVCAGISLAAFICPAKRGRFTWSIAKLCDRRCGTR
jgi:hypothetical protein